MSITKFHEKVYEVNNDLAHLVYELHSAVDLMRIIIENADEEGLLDRSPLAGLRGIVLLFDSVGDSFATLESRSEEVLRLQAEVKKVRRAMISEDVNVGLTALGYEMGEHSVTIERAEELLCVVNMDGKRFGIWDTHKRTFVD